MREIRGRHLIVWIVIAAVVAGFSGTGAAQAKLRVVSFAMATTPPNLVHIPPWVAQETGIFARYGIEAKIFTFEGGPSALRALVGSHGEVQIAAPGVPPFIAAVARGADLRAIATYATKHPVAMVVQQEIKRCQDLRGKKIGTPGGAGAYAEVMTRAVLKTCGLAPKDVQYLNISTGSRVPALVTGQADAFVLHIDQIFEAVKAKPSLHILAYLSDVLPKGWYAAYVTTGDVMRSDGKLLQNVVSALVEANRFIYRNRDRTIEIGVKYTKFDHNIVSRTYDELAKRGIWPVNEGLHKGVVEAGLDTEVQIGTITPDIKPTYAQVVQLGFITAALTKLGRWTGDPRWQ
jgi:ABC-type nitrate/sulfonate/bicarbonate transport system substrate-binding protein